MPFIEKENNSIEKYGPTQKKKKKSTKNDNYVTNYGFSYLNLIKI